MKIIEKRILEYLKERGWDDLRPSDIAKSIVIESAELLELFQWENRSLKEIKSDKKKLEEIKKELADVLIYALDLSVLLEIDTEKIVMDKIEHIKKKYPAELMRKNPENAGQPGNSNYWKIKKQYRKKGK